MNPKAEADVQANMQAKPPAPTSKDAPAPAHLPQADLLRFLLLNGPTDTEVLERKFKDKLQGLLRRSVRVGHVDMDHSTHPALAMLTPQGRAALRLPGDTSAIAGPRHMCNANMKGDYSTPPHPCNRPGALRAFSLPSKGIGT